MPLTSPGQQSSSNSFQAASTVSQWLYGRPTAHVIASASLCQCTLSSERCAGGSRSRPASPAMQPLGKMQQDACAAAFEGGSLSGEQQAAVLRTFVAMMQVGCAAKSRGMRVAHHARLHASLHTGRLAVCRSTTANGLYAAAKPHCLAEYKTHAACIACCPLCTRGQGLAGVAVAPPVGLRSWFPGCAFRSRPCPMCARF